MQRSEHLNSARVMESGDHFKNGASLKSHTSRRNILLFGMLLLVFCAFTSTAMAWTGNGTSSDPWDISDKSTSGNNVKAYVNGSTLYIYGSGDMADFWYSTEGEAPWNYQYYNNSSSITNVVIQSSGTDNVTNIGDRAFHDLRYLEKITIPNTVKIIGKQAFYMEHFTNTSFQEITIPQSVTYIEGEAFLNCSNLKTVTIENGSNTLNFVSCQKDGQNCGYYTYDWFLGCPNLQTLYLGRNINWYASSSNASFISDVRTTLSTLTIGNTVTSIGNGAFNGCSNLKTVTIQNGTDDLTFSGSAHFSNSPIETLYWGRNISGSSVVDYVGGGNNRNIKPFYENSALKSVIIGNDVTIISASSFYNCTGLQSLILGNALTDIGNNAFYGCSSLASALTVPNKVKTIGSRAFQGCRTLPSVIISESVTSIGASAFSDCNNLKTVRIEDGTDDLTFSGSAHFSNSPIETLYWGRNISGSSIVNYVGGGNGNPKPFHENSALKSVTIGNDVTIISANSFYNCTGLTSITIPSNITSIGNSAFSGCSLTEIHSKNPTPPSVSSNNANCFYNVYNTCKLYVPAGSENKYKEADEWKKFYTILPSAIIPIKAHNITIQSHSNGILIETKEPMPVSIYNLSGQKVYESLIAGNTEIGLDKGIYIVKAKNESVKVAVAQ